MYNGHQEIHTRVAVKSEVNTFDGVERFSHVYDWKPCPDSSITILGDYQIIVDNKTGNEYDLVNMSVNGIHLKESFSEY